MATQALLVLLFFILELIALFYLSRLVINNISRLFYRVSRSRNSTVHFLAFLFLPGTILHELSHILLAGVMMVPVGQINVWPQIEGDEVKLGTAEIGQTDPLRRLIIGAAPLIVGLIVILGLLYTMPSVLTGAAPLWQIALVLYVVFQISNTMFSSKKDMEGALAFLGAIFTVILVIFIILKFTNNMPQMAFILGWNYYPLIDFLQKMDFFMLIPLGINAVIGGLARLLVKG